MAKTKLVARTWGGKKNAAHIDAAQGKARKIKS